MAQFSKKSLEMVSQIINKRHAHTRRQIPEWYFMLHTLFPQGMTRLWYKALILMSDFCVFTLFRNSIGHYTLQQDLVIKEIDVNKILSSLGQEVCRNMICMHALTGCDNNSSFYGVSKKVAFDMLLKCPNLLHDFGETFETTATTYNSAEQFVVSCYWTKFEETSVNA